MADRGIAPKYDSPLWQMEAVKTYFERVEILPVGIDYGIKVERIGQYYRPLWMAKAVENKGQWEMRLFPIDPEHPPQPEDLPTTSEAAAMEVELRMYKDWPKYVSHLTPAEAKRDAGPPEAVCGRNVTLFELLSTDKRLLGYHARITEEDGSKDYFYLTLWEEEGKRVWKFVQPPGQLPLYNLPALKSKDFTGIVAIHEGAKSCLGAIAASKDLKHPWQRELAEMTHLAFIGGAHMPYRTDWTPLRRIGAAGTRLVYIFADNDSEGQAAIPKISSQLNTRACAVMFRGDFPRKFDMGEPMPEHLFVKGNYNGPALRELVEPATYATEYKVIDKKRVPVMREVFTESFAYLPQVGGFVSFDHPSRPPIRHDEFNRAYRYLAPKGYDIAKNLTHKSTQLLTWICYRPDKFEDLGHCKRIQRTIQSPEGGKFNAYEPSVIEPEKGDITLWQEYLAHLFPGEADREFCTRFMATLIGRPDLKMELAMMLTSQTKGVGKSTLYEVFLRPLIGPWNCSTIDEHALTSRFASWLPFKRLAFAHEIYLQGRWDAFQSLKTKVTEKYARCELKYLNPMTVDNFCTIIVCSNAPLPLMMEPGDRRWIYPEVGEKLMTAKFAKALRDWANNQRGLQAIMYWAQNYDNYIGRGEHAPLSLAKMDAIEDSRSKAGMIAHDCAAAIREYTTTPACFGIADLMAFLEEKKLVRPEARPMIVKQAVREVKGVSIPKGRYRVNGCRQQVVVNEALVEAVGVKDNGELRTSGPGLPEHLKRPEDLLDEPPF